MKKRFCALLVLLCALTALQAGALEIDTYAYGGSGRDWLYQMAVSDNGFVALTGWTESSDGTLKSRTKTGRSGWLLVIDEEGKEIVNFCTRLGSHDNLCDPVFHEDGTLTVMLFAEDASVGWVKYELLRLDMKGNVLSRKVIAETSEDEERFIRIVGHDDRGYILQETSYRGEGYVFYEVIGYDGEKLRRLKEWTGVTAIADAHVLRLEQEEGKGMNLYAQDEAGNESLLCEAYAIRADQKRPAAYDGFLSLPDGGAAGAGWMLEEREGTEERVGLFTRWDAQGRIVSQMHTPGWGYGALALRPGGFAATAYPWDETRTNDSVWSVYLFDENGVIESVVPLTSDAQGTGHDACVGALGNGTVVTAHVAAQNGDDTVITIIRP